MGAIASARLTLYVCGVCAHARSKHDSPSAPVGHDGARGEDDEDEVFMRMVKDQNASFGTLKLKF